MNTYSDGDAVELPETSRPASASPTEVDLETETPGGVAAAGHDPYAALRLPAFRRYVTGTTLMYIGQQMQIVAVGWEMTLRYPHHKALALSLVGAVGALPVILLALPAGQLADQLNRKLLTIVTVLIMGLSSVGLAAVSLWHAPAVWMYLLLLVADTAAAMGGPARAALMPQIVPMGIFSNAATWASSCFQVASVLGPALGGGIIAIGTLTILHHQMPTLPVAYLFDFGCSVIFSSLLFSIPITRSQVRRQPANLQTLLAGIRFVRMNQIILATISLDLFAVLLGGAVYLLPIYATDILNVGATGFGWMRAAPAIGALVMALTLAHLPPMKNAGRDLLLAVAGFGVATIIFGLSHWFWLSLLMLFLTGALDNISVVVRHTLVQVLTPDEMRGRVSAVNNVFIGASNELGGAESGITAWMFGPVLSVVGGGIGTLLVVIATAMIYPQLRKFGSLSDARAIESTGQTAVKA